MVHGCYLQQDRVLDTIILMSLSESQISKREELIHYYFIKNIHCIPNEVKTLNHVFLSKTTQLRKITE